MSADTELFLLYYADGELSGAELERAETLLRSSPEARAELAALLRQRLMLAEVLAAEPAAAASAEPVVIVPVTDRPTVTAPVPVRPWWHRRRGLVAAVAAAAALLVAAAFFGLREKPATAGFVFTGTAATTDGAAVHYGRTLELPADAGNVEMLLADQSILGVSPDSRISFPAPRQLELERGEVHLVCKHDAERKFVISAGGSTVTALGTEFTVENRPAPLGARGAASGGPGEDREMKSVVRVVVLSGAVMLASQFGELRISAGEGGEVHGGGKPEKVDPGEKGGGKDKDKDKGEAHGLGVGHDLKDADLEKLGEFVQQKLAEGLRGEELAAAIHAKIAELKAAKDAIKEARKDDKGDKGNKGGDGDDEGAGEGNKHQNREQEREGKGGPKDGEGGPKHGPRDGEGKGKGGPKDGEGGPKHGPRDGEGKGKGKGGPKDGEGGPKHGPRDGEGKGKGGPRDGEGGPKHGPRDGEGKGRGKGPRDGEGGPKRGPREGEGKGRGKGGPKDGEGEPGAEDEGGIVEGEEGIF